jgi:phosphinothricin acetyltransferase
MTETIRPATPFDADALCAIYNHYVGTTTVSFEEEPVAAAAMAQRIEAVFEADLPWLVIEVDGTIAGYAYATKWRVRSAYRFSVESTIYMDAAFAGRGLGRRLYGALLDDLRARGRHMVIGGIAQPNAASVALHERLGFRKVAHFSEVGLKFGRRVDVGYWELKLAAPSSHAAAALDGCSVRRIDAQEAAARIEQLADVLVDCVEGGASVNFMLPMARETALRFWHKTIASLERGERTLLVAEDAHGILGTVQLLTDTPDNQPHRADVAKLLVHRRARNGGVGLRLMEAVEEAAREQGRTVLVLDTANPAAERLYERLGWQRVGVVPDFCLMPDGAMSATTFFTKRLKRLGSDAMK